MTEGFVVVERENITVVTSSERGAQGLSAYEIAVKNGFVGTEQQWLNSLGSGGSGGDKTFSFNFSGQNVVVNHGLNKYPSITVLDNGGNSWVLTPIYNSLNQLTFNLPYPVSGRCELN